MVHVGREGMNLGADLMDGMRVPGESAIMDPKLGTDPEGVGETGADLVPICHQVLTVYAK